MRNYACENNNKNANLISLDELALAIYIKTNHGGKSLSKEEARLIAEHVLNFFKPGIDRTLDNLLSSQDRDIFYALEDVGLLGTKKETVSLPDGRDWHIYYWFMKKDEIKRTVEYTQEKTLCQNGLFNYADLTEKTWFGILRKEK